MNMRYRMIYISGKKNINLYKTYIKYITNDIKQMLSYREL